MTPILSRSMMVLFLSTVCLAKGPGSLDRGGMGFLYADNNSFSNSSLFGARSGFAVDAHYDSANSNSLRGATASAVYGNGMVGIGAFDNRSGSDLTSSGSFNDVAGVGAGLNIARGKALVGAGFQKTVNGTAYDTGNVNAAISMRGEKGLGFGLGASQQMGSITGTNIRTATAAIGFGASNGFMVEADVVVKDLTRTSDLTGAAYLTRSGQSAYLSLGYLWHNLISLHGAAARVGFILGKSIDMSLYATHVFTTGASPAYGASLRFAM